MGWPGCAFASSDFQSMPPFGWETTGYEALAFSDAMNARPTSKANIAPRAAPICVALFLMFLAPSLGKCCGPGSYERHTVRLVPTDYRSMYRLAARPEAAFRQSKNPPH